MRLTIPAPEEWINLNHRTHWAVKARRTKAWRQATALAAKSAGLPKGLQHVHITAHIHKTTRREYDAHNLLPTIKACVDGLVDYGLTVDDTNAHVTGPDLRMGEVLGELAVTLVIEPA